MKKHSYSVVNIGSVLLFMTLIVLCLVVFSTLSLSGSVSEYQYSQKLAMHNREYYRVCGQASERLHDIDDILKAAYADSPGQYYTKAESKLKALEGVTTDFSGKSPTITYEAPVSRSQTLHVTLELNPAGQVADGYYKVTAWQKVPSSEWKGDDSLNLIK